MADTEGTIIIVVTFPNPDYLLKSGQFARVRANVGAYREQITVPASAVRQIQGVASVWVVAADSTAYYRQVDIVSSDGKTVAVEGLKVGERVVVDGNARLSNGQKVKVL